MKKLILGCLLLFAWTNLSAQEKETTPQDTTFTNYEFTLKDGTKMVGQLIDQNKESYVIKTSNFGTIKISSNQVVSIILQDQKTKVNKNRSANYFENQFGYKYFIFNTAIPVEPKKWFYTNQYIFFSSFTYGISKHVSAGVLFFTFVPTILLSPNLKITINPDSKTKFALNSQYLYLRENSSSNFVLFQGTMTRGDAQNNFTFGIGKFVSYRGVDSGAVITIGFVKKVSSKLSVISENIIIASEASSSTKSFGLLSAGLRFDRRMHAFDLGLFAPTSGLDRNLNLIPYIGFNLKLSK